jgi:hypothetical protein
MPSVVVFFVGCSFFILGRWLYAHPDRVVPHWSLGAGSKVSNDFGRFMGILFVWVGCGSALFSLQLEAVVGGLGTLILALGGASIITWLTFRKRTTQANDASN